MPNHQKPKHITGAHLKTRPLPRPMVGLLRREALVIVQAFVPLAHNLPDDRSLRYVSGRSAGVDLSVHVRRHVGVDDQGFACS